MHPKQKGMLPAHVWVGHKRIAAVSEQTFHCSFYLFIPSTHNDEGFQMLGRYCIIIISLNYNHYHQSLDNLHHHQWYCSENDLAMRGFLMGNVRMFEWCERLPVGSVSGKGGSFSLPPLPVPCQSTPCLKHWLLDFAQRRWEISKNPWEVKVWNMSNPSIWLRRVVIFRKKTKSQIIYKVTYCSISTESMYLELRHIGQ